MSAIRHVSNPLFWGWYVNITVGTYLLNKKIVKKGENIFNYFDLNTNYLVVFHAIVNEFIIYIFLFLYYLFSGVKN